MKKGKRIVLAGIMLSGLLCMPAMAQTTGIAVDGKDYVFVGCEGSYEADGKTFVIGADTVTIKEPGREDRVLSMSRSDADEVSLTQDTAVFTEIAGEACDAAEAHEEIRVVEDAPLAVCYEQATVHADGALIGQTAVTEYTQSVYTEENAEADPTRFDEYAGLGLYYDAAKDVLSYQGKRVRIFEDSYALDDQSCTSLNRVDDQGTIDVQVQRDMTKKSYRADGSEDLSATLTGLNVLTDAEFAARNPADWTQTETGAAEASTTEGEMTPAEKEAFYAPYADFGVCYDAQTDSLMYRGQRVRSFTDVRRSNGAALEGGEFHGTMTQIGFENGEIDIETIRDYSKPDANGDGTLIGIASEEEH